VEAEWHSEQNMLRWLVSNIFLITYAKACKWPAGATTPQNFADGYRQII